jgi:hypothetical protein
MRTFSERKARLTLAHTNQARERPELFGENAELAAFV